MPSISSSGSPRRCPHENVVYYILNDALLPTNPDAARIVDHVAASPTIKTVVVSEFWTLRGVRGVGLLTTLETLGLAGKTMFVTDDVPYFSFEPFGCKYRKARLPPDRLLDGRSEIPARVLALLPGAPRDGPAGPASPHGEHVPVFLRRDDV